MSKQKIVSGKAEEDVPNDAVPPEKPDFSLIDEAFLKSHIYTIRGVKVMLDADLAAIYGYETRKFNEQVKHNIEKFDDDFRFQLSDSEFTELKSNLMSKFGHQVGAAIGFSPMRLRSKGLQCFLPS